VMTRSSALSASSRAASHAARRARSASAPSIVVTSASRAFSVPSLAGSGALGSVRASSRMARRSSSKSAAVPRRSSSSAAAGTAAGGQEWAGAPTEQLRTQIDRVIKVLEDPEMAKEARMVERRTVIRRVANDIFDFSETTRRSLGPHWHARTPQEREEVTRLYADLLERSYIGKIEMYSGEKIQFL